MAAAPDRGHDHDHDRSVPIDLGPAFKWAIGLNVGYIVVEVVAGLAVGSLALLADAAISLGVVLAAAGMLVTGWHWLDPAAAIVVSLLIALTTCRLLKRAFALSLDAVPAGIDRAAVESRLGALPGVASVHDLHIWSLSTTRTALTAHLVMPEDCPGDAFLADASRAMEDDFGIGHARCRSNTVTAMPAAWPRRTAFELIPQSDRFILAG